MALNIRKAYFPIRNALTVRPIRKWLSRKIKNVIWKPAISKTICDAVSTAKKSIIIYVSHFDYYHPLTQRPNHMYKIMASTGYPVVMCAEKVKVMEQVAPNFFLIHPMYLESIVHLKVSKVLNFSNGTPLHDWKIDEDTVVFYELIDDFGLYMDEKVIAKHKRMFQNITSRRKTWTLVSANHLYDLAIQLGVRKERLMFSRNAVNPEDFVETGDDVPTPLWPIVAKGKPIIGYYGALTVSWFDFGLMKELIRDHQEWEFIFIGFIYADKKKAETLTVLEELKRYDNFTYIPAIPYADIPCYARYFSVATIPFLINQITLGTNPVKLFEYMAMGLPIVTTPMPECRLYQSVLIADDAGEFSEQVEKALHLKNDVCYQDILAKECLENTWKSRVSDILRIIEIETKNVETDCSGTLLAEIGDFLKHLKASDKKTFKRLDADKWHSLYETEFEEAKQIEKNLRDDVPASEWTVEMERLTCSGESVLEVGMALGMSSLYLAKRGRICTGIDFSQSMCDSFVKIGKNLGLTVNAICADITKKLPIADNSFDVVFHAGVIEHFSDDEVQFIINENARITKRRVICMAPNANSIGYMVGKEYLEKNGQWIYGEENPKHTLKDIFLSAGLSNIREYSIDYNSAVFFLPENAFKQALQKIYKQMPMQGGDCFQGYLLVTIGDK